MIHGSHSGVCKWQACALHCRVDKKYARDPQSHAGRVKDALEEQTAWAVSHALLRQIRKDLR